MTIYFVPKQHFTNTTVSQPALCITLHNLCKYFTTMKVNLKQMQAAKNPKKSMWNITKMFLSIDGSLSCSICWRWLVRPPPATNRCYHSNIPDKWTPSILRITNEITTFQKVNTWYVLKYVSRPKLKCLDFSVLLRVSFCAYSRHKFVGKPKTVLLEVFKELRSICFSAWQNFSRKIIGNNWNSYSILSKS